MSFTYTFSVFTPTFNRAHVLHRAYHSLKEQTFRDFEWLIVDDGSADETPDLVAGWQREDALPITYLRQGNLGQYAAVNTGAGAASGEFFLFLDSDDSLVPQALERFKYHWETIPDADKPGFSAVTALVSDPSGRIVGDRFPYDPTDSNSLDVRYKYRVRGEKRGFQRTEVLREFPTPQFPGEKIIPDSMLWYRIALRYKTRYVNEALEVYYPTAPGSLSTRGFLARAKSPRGCRYYYQQMVAMDYPFPEHALLRGYANYIRYSMHGGVSIRRQFQEIPSLARCLIAWPVGLAAYLKDRRELAATGGLRGV